MNGKVTIYDVAKLAGVAPSTVSRTFAAPGRVSATTAQKVQEAADALGYHAAPVPTRRSGTGKGLVAVIVPDLSNPFFAAICRSVQDECSARGFGMVVSESREVVAKERIIFDEVLPYVRGVLLVSSRMPDVMIRKCAQLCPIVVVNRNVRGVPNVIIDIGDAVKQAIRYFAMMGFHRITYLDGPPTSWVGGVKWRTISDECNARNITLRRSHPCLPTIDGGTVFVDEYLVNPTGAVIAYNDLMALGFVAGMRKRGYDCPDSVSVIGFDNDKVAALNNPSLTSIHMPAAALGADAAAALLSRLSGGDVPGTSVTVPARLVLRHSVGRAA
ncbi:LacI family DNA-binding transcriptional regulator [Bifidobacterium sp. CP2]|uniref:LacI family DNA-binding transcriptional regulator n=1 Tax=Bifidobacterium sp. CP2 TaxID=2809025 RepID=UPI001BDD1754|nr:LacI family DNA-binding transcriptional regulator [Bifidobacterium sp. CP2]MBT1180634.1 LacI family DNA-binding transcriptional regulator [Bifidobacterium sp. CP2]